MTYEDSKYSLLPRNGEDVDVEDGFDEKTARFHTEGSLKTRTIPLSILGLVALAISLTLNFVLLRQNKIAKAQSHLCVSEYTGLGLTEEVAYWQHTDYLSSDRSISDKLWEQIDTSPNTIALDEEYVREHNLTKSIPFPWDQSKGLYLIKAFHHMHCLKNLRRGYLDALESHPGQEQLIPQEHMFHCLDILRQDIQCRPDDTLMSSIQQKHKWGDGQFRKCKNWDALVEWTRHPNRHACFKMLDEYKEVPHSLEQFAFCLDGSPYTEIMESYFEEHGHRDPFVGESKGVEGGSSDDSY